jgi:hexosaminidase
MQLRAVTTLNNQVMSKQSAKQDFVLHKAIGSSINYTTPFSKYYPAEGPNTLTDGVRGTFAINKNWHAFSEKNLQAIVDLGSIKLVKSIALGCLQKYRDWIFLPSSVNFETSTDGVIYTAIATIKNPFDSSTNEIMHSFETVFDAINIRYIKVTAVNNVCPIGHPGAGKPGWIFADEIVVK